MLSTWSWLQDHAFPRTHSIMTEYRPDSVVTGGYLGNIDKGVNYGSQIVQRGQS
jgi:hypothetical protein